MASSKEAYQRFPKILNKGQYGFPFTHILICHVKEIQYLSQARLAFNNIVFALGVERSVSLPGHEETISPRVLCWKFLKLKKNTVNTYRLFRLAHRLPIPFDAAFAFLFLLDW